MIGDPKRDEMSTKGARYARRDAARRRGGGFRPLSVPGEVQLLRQSRASSNAFLVLTPSQDMSARLRLEHEASLSLVRSVNMRARGIAWEGELSHAGTGRARERRKANIKK